MSQEELRRGRERIERERELRGDGLRIWESCVLIHKQVFYIYREQGVKGQGWV